MRWPRTAGVMLLVGISCSLWAAKRAVGPSNPDVFESFRMLDIQFTRLDAQFHDLQGALTAESHPKFKHEWQKAAREMRQTTEQISRISARMSSPNAKRRQQLRYRMCIQLHSKARLLNARLIKVAHKASRAVATRESKKVRQAMLNLVLQYQAMSGGYAAVHCDAGAWSCGVPKKEPRKVGYPQEGVKWMCVPRTNACRGILGPRTPLLTPQPLTAQSENH